VTATHSSVKHWDPPGLPPRAENERCARHKGMCAYRDDDPTRCPVCHRSWAVVGTKDVEYVAAEKVYRCLTREEHLANHEPKPKKSKEDA